MKYLPPANFMKIFSYFTSLIIGVLLILTMTTKSYAQTSVNEIFKSHMYGSISYLTYRDFSSVEENELFREGTLYQSSYVLTAGYQINPAISAEFSFLRRDLNVSNAFGDMNAASVHGITAMNTLSLSMVNHIQIIPNRLTLNTKVGYVSAFQGLEVPSSWSSDLSNGNLMASIRREVLVSGRLDFLLLGLQAEFSLTNRISLTTGYLFHKGFTDVAKVETFYNYFLEPGIAQNGTVETITDGSIGGLELSVKYRFK